MTSEPRNPAQPVPAGARTRDEAGARATLIEALAAVLGVEADRIDPDQRFQVLGVDSIVAAELMAAVNERFGTAVAPATLYDHPTPAALARHLLAQGPAAGSGTAGDTVLDGLRAHLAGILHCAPEAIDPRASFPLLGVDSIVAAEFVADINRTYGLAERPVTLYDHPDLTSMALYIESGAAQGPAPHATASDEAVASATASAPRALSVDEVNALLDAVRDDMLTVDEAAALLTSPPA
jgi:polyketide synthase PksN